LRKFVSGGIFLSQFNPNLKPGSKVTTVSVRMSGERYFGDKTPYPVLKPESSKESIKTFRKPVVVIDPGHGGRDPGAIGQNGTYEKIITTKAAHELAARLRKSGRYTVVLTRTKDSYVDHDDRLRKARTSQADLFISIHADSAGNKRGELQGKTQLVGNSHRRAGYYVLLAPDVPAVLLELGFLSNAQDERLLKTNKHRARILSSVERAIDKYMAQR